jgi:hypothetical protein
VSILLAMVGAGQSFHSVPKEGTHCLQKTNTQQTISLGGNTPPRIGMTNL